MSLSDFIVVIPARMGSTRLPGKPLSDIAGKPMVVRVAERALGSRAARVVVATDHRDIQAVCQTANIEVVMTRSDHLSGTERLAEAVELLGCGDDTVVINVQGDEPLIDPMLIDQLATVLVTGNAPVATLANPVRDVELRYNPNVVKVVCDAAGQALYFSRAPIPWTREGADAVPATLSGTSAVLMHIGIYAYRVGFLKLYVSLSPSPLEQYEALEQLRILWHGYPINVACVDEVPSGGVDTPADLQRVAGFFHHQC